MFLNQYQTNFVAIIQQLFKPLRFDVSERDRPSFLFINRLKNP